MGFSIPGTAKAWAVVNGTHSISDKEAALESPGASTYVSDDAGGEGVVKDWTDAEERAVLRKLDMIIMPLVTFGFFCYQLERGNVSNALTSTLLEDVGITQDQFNTGQGLLYLGIVLLEIPSNVVLQRIGPQIWITFQILCFGLVATLQSLQKSYGGFIACRMMLGVVECGYIPGSLYLISMFYKKEELAVRNAAFYLGSGIAGAVGGLFAAGILQLGGKSGLAGWQWLFIIEGSIALFCAVLFILFLPGSPLRPTPLLFPRLHYFDERQRHILQARVVLDDSSKAGTDRPLTVQEILATLKDPRVWPHVLIAVSLKAPTGAMTTYATKYIKSLGFTTLKANSLSSVSSWIGIFFTIGFALVSDRLDIRGPVLIVSIGFYWVFWVAFQQVSLQDSKWTKYAMLTMTQSFNAAWHPLNATWLSLNCQTPQQRSVAMAMFVMAANTGSAVGSQILRAGDAPNYHTGLIVCEVLVSLGFLTSILQNLWYRHGNKRIRDGRIKEGERTVEYIE
ncbi:hypothetical protein P7C70_g6782, partial [Phenoliferia sp. Uapishka_3]